MASKMLRRSGVAVGLVAECLQWRADLVVQVGVGQHHEEVDVLRKEWPGVLFRGYEPHPAMKKQLCEEYPGTFLSVAVGDHDGEAVLHFKKQHKDGASLHRSREPGAGHEAIVKLTTLDDLFDTPKHQRILLWLDCEGSELDALRGGEEFLKKVEVVNVEMTGRPPGAGWCRPLDVNRWLVDHGFWLQWIHTQRSCLGQWDGIYVRRYLFKPQFCCCPSEVERFNAAKGHPA